MPKRLLSVVVLVAAFSGAVYADARSDAKAQVEFGIAVAQRGLWKEAIYRWERATQIDPTYAPGFNNLAVAYEHEGMLDKAARSVRARAEAGTEQRPRAAEFRTVQGNP